MNDSSQNEPEALLLKAEAYSGMADIEAAVEVLRRLIKLDPENFEGHYRLAIALISLNRTADARSEIEIAQRIAPDDIRLSPTLSVIRTLEMNRVD